jgi:hypothetical protein
LTTIILTACGQKSNSIDQKLVGQWIGTTKETKDKANYQPRSMGSKVLKNIMMIEFKENHDFIYLDLPLEGSKDLKYEVTGDKLRIGIGCYFIEKSLTMN